MSVGRVLFTNEHGSAAWGTVTGNRETIMPCFPGAKLYTIAEQECSSSRPKVVG